MKTSINFNTRQYMLRSDFEAFNYSDDDLKQVLPHHHPFYEILFFLEGNVTYQIADQEYVLMPEDLIIIPPHTQHRPILNDARRYRRIVVWLFPDFILSLPNGTAFLKCIESLAENKESVYRLHFNTANCQDLFDCAASIADELSYERPFSNELSSLHVNQLLIMLCRIIPFYINQKTDDDAPLQLVHTIADYISEHLTQDLSLDHIAEVFFLSKFYLSRLFKTYMGITPHNYITQQRLTQAKRLLYNGVSPMEVYKRCGYSDYSSFYRAFRKKYGDAPKRFNLV